MVADRVESSLVLKDWDWRLLSIKLRVLER
jgi:hypothetical protein